MKKIAYLLIPILLMVIIMYVIVRMFILQDIGKGALQVTTKPLSKVYLNGTYLGTTPLCRCEGTNMIRSGEYTLRLETADNNKLEYQEKITINKGVLTVVDRRFGKGATSEGSTISLEPLDDKKATELLVISLPDKADLFLDGNYLDKTPYRQNKLTNSDHTLRLRKDGYKDKSVRIHTPAGYKLIAVINLGLQIEQNQATTSAQQSTTTPTPSAAPGVTSAPTAAKTKVTILQTPNGFLRVRQEASLNGAEIARVSPGEAFDMLQESNGWYLIQLPDGSQGWISGEFAAKQ